ncbi:glycosyltransferase [Aquisalimonas asiatica]|uniref:Glycosyltransferase involved in cell wall bisynthesis n=1 Tax=Aquisalimonas asiatica TaxID=406100 RepID=A0A1H8SP03_9GAMM|nr:glycosyltransferase [Aquisalimonas asiatica]SEO80371.1 Glycosyltransferase involved in cell wall bisynthesis [Aquisalimonas asiatica]
MPKVLFVHDHVFLLGTEGNVYSSGCFPRSVWSRYLAAFPSLTVLGRVGTDALTPDDQERFPLSSAEGVTFVFSESASKFTSLLYLNNAARVTVREQVARHDAVIARLSSELGLLAVREAILQGKPWAVELVDCPWDSYWNYGGVKAKVYAPLMAARVRRVMKRSTHALYVTKEFLQRRYPCGPGATAVSCSNVEIPQLDTRVLRAREGDAGGARERLVLGQIASLKGRFKGIQTVMEALSTLRMEFPTVEYHILGGGEREPWVEEARRWGVEDLCYFDGVLPSGDAVYQWLDSVDVYVHPSFKEGLPRALIEAMSRGCPAVASNVAGTPELLPESSMVRPGDADGLAQKIRNLACDRQRRVAEGRRNFFTAGEYTSDKLSRKRTKFWEDFRSVVVSSVAQGG